MGAIDNALFFQEYYKQTMAMTDKPVPCPIHGMPPVVMVDITVSPHQGKVLCRNVECRLKAIGNPADVIREWNELCKKEE